MMVCFDFLSEPIRFEENCINVLCIENPKFFRSVCNAFINDETEENKIIFSENFIPFKAKGNVLVTYDYFGLVYSNAVIKKLYEQTEKYCNTELSKETVQLKTHIVNYFENIIKEFDYDFDFDYEFNLLDLFKAVNLKPVSDKYNLLNTLVDYILILNKYIAPKCFVLLNLHLYFSDEELDLFYNDVVNNHINILVIESKKTFGKNKYENIIIYDNDFCEIVDNMEKI